MIVPKKWFNSEVTIYRGTITEIRHHIPAFERRSLGLTQRGEERSRLNGRLDMIVRRPCEDDPDFVPVGVVSKDYTLVPHTAVLDVAIAALSEAKITVDDVDATLTITEYGERMALSLVLPDKYRIDPGDGKATWIRVLWRSCGAPFCND